MKCLTNIKFGGVLKVETIKVNKLDPNFKNEVAGHPGGEAVKACFACGACTGGCPASETDDAFDHSLPNQGLANICFNISTEKNTVRQNDRPFTRALQ